MRRSLWPILCILLAACQLGGTGQGPDATAPSPILGDEITTTSLDASLADGDAAPGAELDGNAASVVDTPADVPLTTGEQPSDTAVDTPPEAEVPPEPESAVTDAPEPEVPEPEVPEPELAEPEAPKSEARLRCERRGGIYASSGDTGLRTCVKQTGDGGKTCDAQSDCEGQCLARSRTCAPITPLLGCNEVLQNNGARVNLCLN